MERTIILLALLALTGCADMTPTQKRWAWAGGAILVAGAIAAHNVDHGSDPAQAAGKPACSGGDNRVCH
jgi:hypothetical protein